MVIQSSAQRYDVVLVDLEPTIGSEYNKTRPCVVISPNDMNQALRTVMIAPLTSKIKNWKFRPLITGPKHKSELALDQIRVIDKTRIIKKLGSLNSNDQLTVYETLQEIFI